MLIGVRRSTKGYTYSDCILSRIYTLYCNGSATEDVNYVREDTLEQLDGFSVPSADVILNTEKSLATPITCLETDSDSQQLVNKNKDLNQLLIRSVNRLGLLADQSELIYDFDNQFIPTEKQDATYSYKKERGYFPGVVSIDNLPMYIEGRNRNCSVRTEQLARHKEALLLLNQEGIYPKYARMDSGSYNKDITDFFDEKEILFCIRANRSEGLRNKASALSNWEDITIGTQDYQVNELPYINSEKKNIE